MQRQEASTRQAGSASTSERHKLRASTKQASKRLAYQQTRTTTRKHTSKQQATASQDTTVDIHAHGRTWPRDQVPGVLEGGRGVEHSTFRPTRGPQGLNRHSGYLLEDSTASNRRNVLLLKTPSTESTIFRARGCLKNWGQKPQTNLFGKFGTTLPKTRPSLVPRYQRLVTWIVRVLALAEFGCRWLSQLWRVTEPRPDIENLRDILEWEQGC